MKKQVILAESALIGENLEKRSDCCILISGKKIEKIIDKVEFLAQSWLDYEVINVDGYTVMPGMIECHNHLALDARLPEHLGMMGNSETELAIIAMRGLEDDLMSGVTTARCMGDRHYMDVIFREQIACGNVKGPNLLAAGIGMKGRHGHGYVGMPHSGVEEFRRTARENMYRGVDLLKIFVTAGAPPMDMGGGFIPYYISYDEIKTVVEEGKQLNIPTAAHCIGGEGLRHCVKAGVDVIEHAYALTEEDAKLIQDSGIWIDLTAGIFLDPSREPYCPESFVKNARKNRDNIRRCMENVMKYNLPFTLGTDAYHSYLYRELEYAVEMGASNLDALKGVTVNAARMCRISDSRGYIQEGMDADIIAVNGDPLKCVAVMENVGFVMKQGFIQKNAI